MVEHFIRHGNYMTHVSIVTDPVYMTEPLMKSEDLEFDTSESGRLAMAVRTGRRSGQAEG